ncbi:MAG TPA: lycopene cyclase family protein [Ktedonobacteraceae bacterium]|nr:lycopene cyclase family protein [Ktedonobacteraceae bacterium]
MKSYDVIIAGGGASGLSLASHLAHSPLRDRSILIVEKDAKDQNDRTWCFWTNQPIPFDDIKYRSWSQLQVMGEHFDKTLDLNAYRYSMVRGIDFYRFARQTVSECPNVEFLHGTVELIMEDEKQAYVLVDGKKYAGTWVFDSLFDWSTFKPDPTHYHTMKQQFKGWEIEATEQHFNPQVATFLDFRTPQENGTHFFYVLPFSGRGALVESVLCTTTPVNRELCEQSLQDYLKSILRIKEYKILHEEHGISPLTDWRFPRQLGKHIMAIGTHGGMVKPSTGYAFLRMQADSSAIINSLLKVGHPFGVTSSPRRYRYFDAVLLEIMAHHAERIEPIFTSLFERNPVERIFRFLDEVSSLGENVLMLPAIPPQLLLQAFFQLGALRWV